MTSRISPETVTALVVLAVFAFASACGGDDGGDRMMDPDGSAPTLGVVSGDGQREAPGDSVPEPMVVEVAESGSPVQGATVSWTLVDLAGPGASLTEGTSSTDAQGRASSRLVLGSEAGDYRVEAVLASVDDTVAFTATAETPEVRAVEVAAGDGQAATVDQTLSDSLVVHALDQFDDPISDAVVRFAVTRGGSAGASVDPDSTRTDGSGRAATTLTLGSKNGTYRAVAVAGPDSASFSAEASGGTEDLLAVDSVRPTPLSAGGTATVFGAGFSTTPGDDKVIVDGKTAPVTAATAGRLDIDVPTYVDECLPRRSVDVVVAVDPDTAPPLSAELVPSVAPLSLSAGEDTLLVGPADVGCVLLPGSAQDGAEYEVMATTTPDALGTQAMELFVSGSAASSADVASPTGRVSARRFRGPAGQELPEWRRAQYEWDRRLREMERPWLDEIRARARTAPSMSRTVGRTFDVASVGDSATFTPSCTGQDDVRAVAKTVSSAAVIYEDTVMASQGVGFSDARYDSVAARFDTLSFAVDTTYFGAPKDIDGNGRVIMLFTPAVNRLDGDYRDGFIVGYFCSTDLFANNNAEMFYLVSPDPSGGLTAADDPGLEKDFIRSIIEGTVIHEFQHLINAQIGGGSSPTAPNPAGASETWLNEGLSHLAEEVGGHAVTGFGPGQELTASDLTADSVALSQFYQNNFINLSRYLASPHSGTGAIADGAGFRTRGAAWSFVRYLLDRFMAPGTEEDLTRALVQSSVSDGRGAVEDAVQSAAGRSVTFEHVLTDWGAMFTVEDRGDLGGPARAELELTSYRLRDVYGDVPFGSGGRYPLRPPSAIRRIGLDESTSIDADLFTGAGRYVRLVSTEASSGTGLRLATDAGEDLDPTVAPRLVVVRTK